jgi:hypothetical protein
MRHLPGKNSPGSTISTLKIVSNKREKNGQLQQLTELGVRDIPRHHTSSHATHKAKRKPASTLPLLPAISSMVRKKHPSILSHNCSRMLVNSSYAPVHLSSTIGVKQVPSVKIHRKHATLIVRLRQAIAFAIVSRRQPRNVSAHNQPPIAQPVTKARDRTDFACVSSRSPCSAAG